MRFSRAVFLFALPALLYAHSGEPLEPPDLWTAWELDPGVVIPLVISGLLYAAGSAKGVTRLHKLLFWSGWITLALALISPLHPLGEVLFSAHMAQHEVLMLLAAPLFVLSEPLIPMLRGLPLGWRRSIGQFSKASGTQCAWNFITHPVSAWTTHALAIWLWHAPTLFQATLTNEWVHAAQHVSFFGSALLYWWSTLRARSHIGYGGAVLSVFTTAVHTSILGALLTFSRGIWYPAYAAASKTWGVNPLEDQQLGGLIMWIPGGIVYLVAGLALFAAWLRESESLVEKRTYAN